MKTLKKTLCLVLAVVMVVGVLVLPASAADEIDYAAKYEEALGVLKGIGVLNGKEDGELHPEQTLTRAEASTIIARMLNGDESAATYPTAGLPFSDTNADAWYAPYVAYCVDIDIIAGDENGKFNPDDEITGTDFAKMVLVAIGFDPVENGFVNAGSKYEANVAKALRQAKLTAGLESVDLSAPIKRGEVAQLAFNGIKYSTSGETTLYTVMNDEGNILYSGDDAEKAYYAWQNGKDEENGSYKMYIGTSFAGSLAATVFDNLRKETPAGTDDYGRPTVGWVNGSEAEPNDVYTKAKTPDATYDSSNPFTGEDVTDAMAGYVVYYNGDENVLTLDDLYVDDTTGKNGYEIEVYVADTTIVVREAYFANVSKIEKDVLTLTVYEVGYLQTNKAGVEIELKKADDTADYAPYAAIAPYADSYIGVYVKSGTLAEGEGTILDVVELTSEDVEITRRDINSDADGDEVAYLSTIRANGTDIGLNVEFVRIREGEAAHAIPAVPSEGTLYTLNGTALGFVYASDDDGDDDDTTPETGYAYVLDWKDVTAEDNGIDEGWTDEKVTDPNAGDVTYWARLWTVDNESKEIIVTESAEDLQGYLVKFTATDDGYELEKVEDEVETGSATSLKITKAVAEGVLESDKVVFDSATYFFVATSSGKENVNDTVIVYKGIGNVPSLIGGDDTYVQYVTVTAENGEERISYVLVKDQGEDNGDDTKTVNDTYFIAGYEGATLVKEKIGTDANGKAITIEYYEFKAVVDGEIVKVKVDPNKVTGADGILFVKSVDTDDNDVIVAVGDKVAESTSTIEKVSNDVIKAGDKSYYVPSSVTVYQYDTKGNITKITLDDITEATEGYIVANGDTLTALYVAK